MKISCIMPVRLVPYEGQTNKPIQKFHRAVDSFVNQTHKDKELIIISDGCLESAKIVKTKYAKYLKSGEIILVEVPHKELFNGSVRQTGINWATGDILCNIDADDEILPNHLYNLNVAFDLNQYDWGYFNIYRKLDNLHGVEELVTATPDLNSLCTTNVLWKRGLDVDWTNCSGRQDNKCFNRQLLEKYPKKIKLYGAGYIIHHANFKLA